MKRAAIVVGVIALAAAGVIGQRVLRDRIERQRVEARLHELEAEIRTALPPGSSRAKVIAFLDARNVEHERRPGADHLTAYLGEWQGPVFQRGIHLIFYFDEHGALTQCQHREVEGS
jgi:hypothetical protein